MASIIQLECDCNNYEWGKKGEASLAAKYASATPGTSFRTEPDKYYSEIWMGTHPTLPARVLETGEELKDYIKKNPEKTLGKAVSERFGKDLPFLPKILSIEKALPLQIHPNKKQAEHLHEKDSKSFGDSNHKPEIAIALSETFECFVGWKPLTDVKDLFDNIPCLKPLTQGAPGLPNWNRDTLKYMVRKFLKLDDQQVKDLFKGLCEATDKEWGYQRTGRDLLQRLGKQYDRTDPGNLVAVICMNFMTLTRGESIHIPADDVHAYLHGECVECMATSDNVVNTGFAPPEDRDPDLFCESANWISKSPGDWVIRPDRSTKGKLKHTRVYAPPHLSEFNMLMTRLRNGAAEDLAGINGPTIMFVTNGQGMLKSKDQSLVLKEGYVFFVEPNTPFEVKAEEGTDMELHMAYCEGDMS